MVVEFKRLKNFENDLVKDYLKTESPMFLEFVRHTLSMMDNYSVSTNEIDATDSLYGAFSDFLKFVSVENLPIDKNLINDSYSADYAKTLDFRNKFLTYSDEEQYRNFLENVTVMNSMKGTSKPYDWFLRLNHEFLYLGAAKRFNVDLFFVKKDDIVNNNTLVEKVIFVLDSTGFAIGNTLTGLTSGATGLISSILNDYVYFSTSTIGTTNFLIGETVSNGLLTTTVVDTKKNQLPDYDTIDKVIAVRDTTKFAIGDKLTGVTSTATGVISSMHNNYIYFSTSTIGTTEFIVGEVIGNGSYTSIVDDADFSAVVITELPYYYLDSNYDVQKRSVLPMFGSKPFEYQLLTKDSDLFFSGLFRTLMDNFKPSGYTVWAFVDFTPADANVIIDSMMFGKYSPLTDTTPIYMQDITCTQDFPTVTQAELGGAYYCKTQPYAVVKGGFSNNTLMGFFAGDGVIGLTSGATAIISTVDYNKIYFQAPTILGTFEIGEILKVVPASYYNTTVDAYDSVNKHLNVYKVAVGVSGFVVGDKIKGATSLATAYISYIYGDILYLTNVIGTFTVSETVAVIIKANIHQSEITYYNYNNGGVVKDDDGTKTNTNLLFNANDYIRFDAVLNTWLASPQASGRDIRIASQFPLPCTDANFGVRDYEEYTIIANNLVDNDATRTNSGKKFKDNERIIWQTTKVDGAGAPAEGRWLPHHYTVATTPSEVPIAPVLINGMQIIVKKDTNKIINVDMSIDISKFHIIVANTDFPLLATVPNDFVGLILAGSTVTDDAGALYTNTGQTFTTISDMFIYWDFQERIYRTEYVVKPFNTNGQYFRDGMRYEWVAGAGMWYPDYLGTIITSAEFNAITPTADGQVWYLDIVGSGLVTYVATGQEFKSGTYITWDDVNACWRGGIKTATLKYSFVGTDYPNAIRVAADFPTAITADVADFYVIISKEVIDDDATKTNTLQKFYQGERIIWDGVSAWIRLLN